MVYTVNQLIEHLKKYKEDNKLSYRQLSSITNTKLTLLFYVMTGERNLTSDFCIAVSGILDLEIREALEMGGLLNDKQGDQAASAQSPCIGERNGSIPKKL